MGLTKKLLKLVRRSSSAKSPAPPPSQTVSQQASTAADPATEALLERLLGEDNEQAAAAAEALFTAASQSRGLAARLAAHTELLYRLRQLLRQQQDGGDGQLAAAGKDSSHKEPSAAERLQVSAADLVSALAGASAASDAKLVEGGMVAALLTVLTASRSWSATRGALRALSRLLNNDEAALQVAQGGGLASMAALLHSEDLDLVQHCLAILTHVCSAPGTGPAMADVVAAGGLGPLVRLLEVQQAEVQAKAAEVLKLMCRVPETGALLTDLGGIGALARVAEEGQTLGAKVAARMALQRVGEASVGRPQGQHALQALHPVGLPQQAQPASSVGSLGSWASQSASQPPVMPTSCHEAMSAELVRQSLAGLASPAPLAQLAAAQRLSSAAASPCGAQLLAAAQGAPAMLTCLSQHLRLLCGDNSRNSSECEPGVSHAVVAAVLGALGMLCQQDVSATGSVASMLRTKAQGQDAHSVQLTGELKRVLVRQPAPCSPGAPCGGPCCRAAPQAEPVTPPSHKQQQGGNGGISSPYSVVSPPGSTGAASAQHSGASRGSQQHQSHRHHHQPQLQQGDVQGSVVLLSTESSLLLVPAAEELGSASPRCAVRGSDVAAGTGSGPAGGGGLCGPRSHLLPHGSSSQASRGASSQAVGGTHSTGGASDSGEARDQFNTDAVPSSLMCDDQGWIICREDIAICQDEEGNEIKLGEGGFGTVLKAVWAGVDEVALKRIRPAAPGSAGGPAGAAAAALALFTKEIRVLGGLRHKNVVQFYGACVELGSCFLVTELMRGGDLYGMLRRQPRSLAWGRMGRKVALDVALGLNYLHTRRPPLLHRDLKGPNVLLSEEGVAKIADCGMMRPQVAGLVTAQPVLTPLWAAPEVLRRERASIKADIWSYGILVWEIVSGKDITLYQPMAFTRQMEQGFTPAAGSTSGPGDDSNYGESYAGPLLMELPRGCPPVAAHIFQACTQLDPARRPTAAQIVEWLRGCA